MDSSDEEELEQLNQTVISDDTTPSSSLLSQSVLFSTIENAVTVTPIVAFFKDKQISEAKGIVGKLNRVKSRRLFAALLALLSGVVDNEEYSKEEESNDDENEESSSLQSLRFLKMCADFLHAHISSITKSSVIDEVFEMASLLHDSLFPLHQLQSEEHHSNRDVKTIKHAKATSASIFALCEKWWHLNLEDKEQLVTQLIPLQLLSSLDEHSTKSHVKRLYSMREAFDLLDFNDPSISSLHTQLLRTVSHPLFLQCVEGKKFLSHLFTIKELIASLHAVVRVQIMSKKSILTAYGDVYWGAWKIIAVNKGVSREEDTENDTRMEARTSLEENALQDLAYMTIHAVNPTTAKNCRVILDKFLLYKKDPEVEGMLYRVYGPILWRSLIAANARVRMQATAVLGDTFPLKDNGIGSNSANSVIASGKKTTGKVGYEAVVTKTVEAIVKLMRDEVPSVRVQGCICAGKILRGFWVAIPSSDIRVLLNEIVSKHASDTTSAVVRTTSIQTITSLLSEDKTHAVLRPLLPSLGNVIHDKTEKVRLAVVKMLLVVKKLKGMKYYHVVPAKHLLARLADEGRGKNNSTGPVAKGLTELLSNSFFPTGNKKTMADVIGRTFRLLQDNPAAALVFYRNASTQLSIHSIAKLISALMKCLCFLIVQEKKGMSEDVSMMELSQIVEEVDFSCLGDGAVGGSTRMAIVAESISVLLDSIDNDLKDADEGIKELLVQAFSSNVITEVFSHFGDGSPNVRALLAIMNCAGKMDAENMEGLRAHVVADIEKSSEMSVAQRSNINISPHLSLLCAWGMTEEVATCLALSTSNSLEGVGEESKKKKTRGKTAGISLPILHIDVCLDSLGHILQGSHPTLVSARNSILSSEAGYIAILTALQKAQDVTVQILRPIRPMSIEVNDTVIQNIGRCIECHGKLLLHKEAQKDEISTTMPVEALSLITWVSESVVPSLTKVMGQDNILCDLNLSGISEIDSPICSPGSVPTRSTFRNSSFPRLSLGLGNTPVERGSFNVYQDHIKHHNIVRAAVLSMRSVMLMIADWFYIYRTSHAILTNNLVNWCQVIRCSDDTIRQALLPLFARVALLSLSHYRESLLLNEVLAFLEDDKLTRDEEQTMASFICRGLISMKHDSIKIGIASIVKILCSNNQKYVLDEVEANDTLPILEWISPGIKSIIMSLLSDNRGSLVLADHLVNDTTVSVKADLLKEICTHATKTSALNKILKDWCHGNVNAEDGDVTADSGSIENGDTLPKVGVSHEVNETSA